MSEEVVHAEEASESQAWLGVFLRGAAMGAADTVPGVSGGTVALITGVYERLITALSELDPRIVLLAPDLASTEGRRRVADRLVGMDVPFLLVLGLGVFSALITVSRVLEVALTDFRGPTFAFFFGLIAASAVVLYGEVDVTTPRRALVAVAGVVVAYLLTDPSVQGALPSSLPVVFLVGAVVITAMILPGISGSFLLLLFGQYEFVFGALSSTVDGVIALVRGGAVGTLFQSASVVVTFGLGAVVGLLTVSRVIRRLLDRYRVATLTFLVSLMVGALRLPLVEMAAETPRYTAGSLAPLVGAALVGGVAVLLVDRYTDDLDLDGDGR